MMSNEQIKEMMFLAVDHHMEKNPEYIPNMLLGIESSHWFAFDSPSYSAFIFLNDVSVSAVVERDPFYHNEKTSWELCAYSYHVRDKSVGEQIDSSAFQLSPNSGIGQEVILYIKMRSL